MRVLFVHGRSQQNKDPAQLQQSWSRALRDGASKAGVAAEDGRFYFPYYGDLLARHAGLSTGIGQIDQVVRSSRGQDNAARVYDELINEYSETAAVRAQVSEGFPSGLPQVGGRPVRRASGDDLDLVERGERLNAVLRVAEALAPGLGDFVVKTLSDVATYLSDKDARSAVLDCVERSAREAAGLAQDGPFVVVAHSLGSVVAHDLFTSRALPPVDLFVTLGSPLGVRSVYTRLLGWSDASSKLWPPPVRRWVNASDPGDLVALVPALGRKSLFSRSSASASSSERSDVLNLVDIDNWTPNRHGIDGYLSDPGVARAIFSLAKC